MSKKRYDVSWNLNGQLGGNYRNVRWNKAMRLVLRIGKKYKMDKGLAFDVIETGMTSGLE